MGIDNCYENYFKSAGQRGRGKIKDGHNSYKVLTLYKSQDPLLEKQIYFTTPEKFPLNIM